jgi:putative membrane protein
VKAFFLSMALLAPTLVWGAESSPDASFYKNLAEGGLAEVDAGHLAQSKSTNAQVKEFGAMMVKDHSAANDKLKSLADSKGVKLPTSSSAMQQASEAKLKALSGQTFDRSYLRNQLSAHEDTVKLLNKEISTGKDPEAKAFAKTVLPTVEMHLKSVKALVASEGASK